MNAELMTARERAAASTGRQSRGQASVATRRVRLPALAWGLAAAMALLLLYVGIVGGASRSPGHVLELLATDWPFVAALAAGFGTQVGLYAYLRGLTQAASAAAGATTGVGTGTSTVAMIACCAHHAADILPILGLSAVAGAAGFLAEWRVPLMSLGIVMNLIGIALSVRLVRQARRHLRPSPAGAACH
jgi:hypothetical protein